MADGLLDRFTSAFIPQQQTAPGGMAQPAGAFAQNPLMGGGMGGVNPMLMGLAMGLLESGQPVVGQPAPSVGSGIARGLMMGNQFAQQQQENMFNQARFGLAQQQEQRQRQADVREAAQQTLENERAARRFEFDVAKADRADEIARRRLAVSEATEARQAAAPAKMVKMRSPDGKARTMRADNPKVEELADAGWNIESIGRENISSMVAQIAAKAQRGEALTAGDQEVLNLYQRLDPIGRIMQAQLAATGGNLGNLFGEDPADLGGANAATPPQQGPVRVTTQEQYDALPAGTNFIDTDGIEKIKK